MTSIAVLASGAGSNLQAIMDKCQLGMIKATLAGVIVNVPEAYALTRAQNADIPTALIDHRQYDQRQQFDAAVAAQLQAWQPDWIILAGFMRILTPDFVNTFQGKLINIHPSLLPAYKGRNTHERVLASGERHHGASVHFVTPELDSGAVIAQSVLSVAPNETVDQLAKRVNALEHVLYPRVVSWLAEGRVQLRNREVVFNGQLLAQPIQFWQNLT